MQQQQLLRAEENRRRALERLQAKKDSSPVSSTTRTAAASHVSTHASTHASNLASTSASPHAPTHPPIHPPTHPPTHALPPPPQPLPKKVRLNVDYDLSTIKDSRGGFLFPDDKDVNKKSTNATATVYSHTLLPPAIMEDTSALPQCRQCGSHDVDLDILRHYRVQVCKDCRESNTEKYTLLTKTEVKEDYLLTDEELRDTVKVPFWEKGKIGGSVPLFIIRPCFVLLFYWRVVRLTC